MGIDRLHFVGLILACIGCASGGQTGAPSIFDGGVDFTVADGGHDLPDGALADAGPIPDGMIEPEEPFEPAPPTIYRLTQAQYRNVISDVFGPDIQVPEELEPDTPLHGFASIGAGELSISPVAVEQYEAAAQQIAQQILADPSRRAQLFECAEPADDTDCLSDGIGALGRLLWRRPLTEMELRMHVDLVAALTPGLRDPWIAIRFAVAALLQSPHFLFRIERGEVDPGDPTRRRYSDYEMAGRLAFLFWNRGPDDALLTAAGEGRLTTGDGLRAEAERLAGDERAKKSVLRFFGEFLNLDRLDELQKERMLFPLMSDTLGAAMRTEIELILQRIVFGDDADIRTLLTTRDTTVNSELAALYQLPGVTSWTDVEFGERWPRAGLLTTVGFLAMNAHNTLTSPTHRGKYIQNKILCFDVPPPPPGVVTSLELVENEGPVTTRQKLERHRSDPTCAGCHVFMDPLGLALENFDAIGMWRTTENGLPIDAGGELDGVPFRGAKRLGRMLAERTDFADCIARQLYRHGMGHLESRGEEPAIQGLQSQFTEAQFRFSRLMIAMAVSDAFRRPGGPE